MSRIFLVFAILFCVVVRSSAQEVRDVYLAPRALFPFDPLTDRYEPHSLASVATYLAAWRDEGTNIRLHVSTVNFSRGTLLYLSMVDNSLLNRVLNSIGASLYSDTVTRQFVETIYDFPQSRDFLSSFAVDIERVKHFYSTALCRMDTTLIYDPYAPSALSGLVHDFQLAATGADVSVFAPSRLNIRLDSVIYIRQVERLFPHDNQLVVIIMSGTQFRVMLENIYGSRFYGLSNEQSDLLNINLPPSMHASVAGVSFSVNLTRAKGNRIEDLELDEMRTYRVAINSFAASKLGVSMFVWGDYKTLFIKHLKSNSTFTTREQWRLKPERWVEKIKQRENLQIRNL